MTPTDAMRPSVEASTHQGSSSFKFPGRQCMFNAIASCFMNEVTPVDKWSTKTLDKILRNGDWLYGNACITDSYPFASDLGKFYWIDGHHWKVHVGDAYYGSITDKEGPFVTFERALENVGKYSVLTMGSSTPAYSYCVIKNDNSIFVFDSHSRDTTGMASCDGKATLTAHSPDTVAGFMRDLLNSLKATDQFELTAITITSLSAPKLPNTDTEPIDICLLCQESDDSDSDTSSDVPLSEIKCLQTQVEQQRRSKCSEAGMLAVEGNIAVPESIGSGDIDSPAQAPISRNIAVPESIGSGDTDSPAQTTISDSNHTSNTLPPTTTRGRRRQRQPESWVFNIAKRQRNHGQEYKTRKEGFVPFENKKRTTALTSSFDHSLMGLAILEPIVFDSAFIKGAETVHRES
ncbi:ATP-dependent DNA helicase [Plakobranchus ocellatus]|uniref:ATP-dependent DNA helicase n=1 Tax=Plakobranchus ocellatus TaxID=259542 RepID=A0AAV3YJM1_9GAST|nr:ATP-dependent DNA helicase [Plakobranchus ocellatus]